MNPVLSKGLFFLTFRTGVLKPGSLVAISNICSLASVVESGAMI